MKFDSEEMGTILGITTIILIISLAISMIRILWIMGTSYKVY